MPDEGPPRTRPVVDARQLWAGGAATAVVAALVALVGVVVCRWLFNIPLLAPSREGAYGDAHTTSVVLLAAAAALLATGLLHLLLAATPRPLAFFSWIVGLVTLLMVLFPFSTSAPLSQKIATAVVDLVIGFAIGSLLNGVGARSLRRRRRPAGPVNGAPYGQEPYGQMGPVRLAGPDGPGRLPRTDPPDPGAGELISRAPRPPGLASRRVPAREWPLLRSIRRPRAPPARPAGSATSSAPNCRRSADRRHPGRDLR